MSPPRCGAAFELQDVWGMLASRLLLPRKLTFAPGSRGETLFRMSRRSSSRSPKAGVPKVECLFHEPTRTATYLVSCPETMETAIIDSALDFDLASGQTTTKHIERTVERVKEAKLKVKYVMETHMHADHLTGAQQLKKQLGGRVVIGHKVKIVQKTFKKIYNTPDVADDGSQFDLLVKEGDSLPLGNLKISVLETPGHTPACVSYVIGDAVFTGDALFMHDSGCGRCDFPNGSATDLYNSIQKLMKLPDATRVFVAHDYGAGGKRDFAWESTVELEKKNNPYIVGMDKEKFVKKRQERDATLSAPNLLLPSIQVNMRAGHLPPAESNGTRYLKTPLSGDGHI